jgi:uncharacterized membrane protein
MLRFDLSQSFLSALISFLQAVVLLCIKKTNTTAYEKKTDSLFSSLMKMLLSCLEKLDFGSCSSFTFQRQGMWTQLRHMIEVREMLNIAVNRHLFNG